MFWTHGYDLLCKIAGMAVIIGIFILGINLLPHEMPLLAGGIGIIVGGAVWYMSFRPLSSWCYSRFSLKADLTFADSRRASILFSPLFNLMKWHPMRQVKDLPQAQRRAAIMEAANELLAYHDERSQELRAAPLSAKILRALLWVLLIGVVVTGLGDLPPMSWVSGLQAMLFGGYYLTFVTVVVGMLPIFFGMVLLERKHGVRSFDPQIQAMVDSARKSGKQRS